MKTLGRAALTFLVFGAIYVFTYWIPFSLLLATGIAWLPNVPALAVGAAAGWWVWKRTAAAPVGRVEWMMYGAAVVGAGGFSAGFFIPILFNAWQGPLLGLFITGPLGAVVGGVGGAVAWSRRRRDASSSGLPNSAV